MILPPRLVAVDPGSVCSTSGQQACRSLRSTYADPAFAGLSSTSSQSSLLDSIVRAVSRAVGGFFHALGPIPSLLIALAILGIAFLVFRLLRGRREPEGAGYTADDRLGGATHDEEWRAAEAAAARGDYREAVRRGFRSALLALAAGGRTRVEPAWTTRELLRVVARDEGVAGELAVAGGLFERAWYSHHPVDAAAWEEARGHCQRLRALARRTPVAA